MISIRGEDCSMENLGKLADLTSGTVEIVNPLELGSKVVSILNKPVVATSVECHFYIHINLRFTFPEFLTPKASQNVLAVEVGNVTEDSDETLEFKPNEFFEPTGELPFQAQIWFTTPDGGRYLRVVTRRAGFTHDREEAEKRLDSAIMALHAVHKSATLAQSGNYLQARVNLISNQRLLQRGMRSKSQQTHYVNFIKQSERLDGFMREAQQQDDVFSVVQDRSHVDRAAERDDSAAKNIVQMKKISLLAFDITV